MFVHLYQPNQRSKMKLNFHFNCLIHFYYFFFHSSFSFLSIMDFQKLNTVTEKFHKPLIAERPRRLRNRLFCWNTQNIWSNMHWIARQFSPFIFKNCFLHLLFFQYFTSFVCALCISNSSYNVWPLLMW